ncbi:MAG: energy transducer TonB [Pyrinomonadaceae bacterium]
MKQCLSCQEEIGDKFSFCPVCGTPLQAVEKAVETSNARVAETVPVAAPSYFSEPDESNIIAEETTDELPAAVTIPTPAVTEAANGFAAGHILSVDGTGEMSDTPINDDILESVGGTEISKYIHDDGEYHLTIMDDSGLVSRLAGEIGGVARQSQLTWPEFKRDPIGFFKRSATGYGRVVSNFFGNKYIAAAIGVSVLVIGIFAVGIWVSSRFATSLQLLGARHIGRFSVLQITMFVLGVAAFGLISATLISWITRRNTAIVIGGEERDKTAATSGVAVALGLPLIMAAAFIFFFFYGGVFQKSRQNPNEDLVVENLVDIPDVQPTPDEGTAGKDKGTGGGSKPKQEKPGGGGGGGRQEETPASQGKLPPASNNDPIVAPNPKPPPPTKDPLIVPPNINADPTLFPPDRSSTNFGDPNSKTTATSSGPGTNGGIGTGDRGGVGPGSGNGVGPGNGRNTGGGDPNDGGGGPGGGGGGTDYNKVFSPKEVNQKARILSKPSPEYTEQARVNQTVGTVRLQAVFSSSGQVTGIRPLNQLPYGLTDKAIAACRRIQFSPAMKDGRAVSQYVTIEYNFNIY